MFEPPPRNPCSHAVEDECARNTTCRIRVRERTRPVDRFAVLNTFLLIVRRSRPLAGVFIEVRRMNIRLVLFSVLILTFTSAGAAGDKLSMKVSPAIAFAPANLTIRTIVE